MTAAPAHADSGYEFSFPNPDKMSMPLVHLENAELGYDGTPVLQIDDLRINPGDRIGVLGANGAGKSTLVKTLAGDLDLVSGQLHRGYHSKVGYFAQHQLEQLDVTATPLSALEATPPTATEQAYRNYLGGWGFTGDAVKRAIRYFSGGEKARLVLALIAWQRPAVLFLDEPTNHLDLDMRHALSVALQNYSGALILVAHDRELLAGTIENCWLVADGTVAEFAGGVDSYAEHVRSRFGRAAAGRNEKRSNRKNRAEQRAQTKPLRDRIKAAERDIEKITTTLDALEAELADPDTYETLGKEAVAELVAQQGQFRKRLKTAEHDWLEAHDALEQQA
jgi:ATP-binding cassette subfamily F protein 3